MKWLVVLAVLVGATIVELLAPQTMLRVVAALQRALAALAPVAGAPSVW